MACIPLFRKETAARTKAYGAAVHHLGRLGREQNGLPDLFAMASQNWAAADAMAGLERGQRAHFLTPGDRAITFHGLESAERIVSERFAAALERNTYELRPFTTEEFGNRDLSPYSRVTVADSQDLVAGEITDEPVSEARFNAMIQQTRGVMFRVLPAPENGAGDMSF